LKNRPCWLKRKSGGTEENKKMFMISLETVVYSYIDTNMLEECSASIFRAYPEDGGTTFF
jgi:hypothetical protein